MSDKFIRAEDVAKEQGSEKHLETVSLVKSIAATFRNKKYILWLIVYSFMTFGVQLFLSGPAEWVPTNSRKPFDGNTVSLLLLFEYRMWPMDFSGRRPFTNIGNSILLADPSL